MNPLKVGDLIILTAALALFGLAITGCALFSKSATTDQKLADVRNLALAASSIGTQEALAQNASWRPRFEDAERNLNALIETKTVTGALLRNIVGSLPVKELRSKQAVILITEVTTLFDATVGTSINVEQQPYVLAFAQGLRDGLHTALAN
jgi:hypothetical protein